MLFLSLDGSNWSPLEKLRAVLPEDQEGVSSFSVVGKLSDPDPHRFGCPGSGSVLGMRIRIQEGVSSFSVVGELLDPDPH